MSNYPPKGLPDDVELYELSGGLPVSKGSIPGCPFFVALWGSGAPTYYGNVHDGPWSPPVNAAIPAKRVSEQEFRQLITMRLAGY